MSQSPVQDALHAYGHRTEAGRWWFSTPTLTHTEDAAVAIVESCLTLGVPVTDVITSKAWHKLVSRVITLEQRLAQLESQP